MKIGCVKTIVMGWLWHSMEPHIATTVEFCNSSKKIWNSLSESFSHQSNVPRVYDLYEQIFATKQSGRTLSEYYGTLKNLWEQLLQHRPFTADLEQQKRHWEEFTIATLLHGLDQELKGFKDQILASESLPTAANAYSRLLRSSLGQSSNPSPNLIESSAFVSSSSGRGGFHGGRSTRGVRGGRTGGRAQPSDPPPPTLLMPIALPSDPPPLQVRRYLLKQNWTSETKARQDN
ncbi:hypothetical protein IFM89_016487 [Coptis chinensis]|uniref:Retrotransposon gag domain-containing protein n=1 Tax=Coptis chinensis TaxID=261450 RepID=A0A835HW86_9MAGN|nr:hypothetical protein IFM89_016487 [Coptis chinensis]